MEKSDDTKIISGHKSEDTTSVGSKLDVCDIEGQVIRYWSEVLDIDVVSPDDEFVSLGGNSVQAMQIISRLRSRLGINIPVRLLFDESTPAGIARAIIERSKS